MHHILINYFPNFSLAFTLVIDVFNIFFMIRCIFIWLSIIWSLNFLDNRRWFKLWITAETKAEFFYVDLYFFDVFFRLGHCRLNLISQSFRQLSKVLHHGVTFTNLTRFHWWLRQSLDRFEEGKINDFERVLRNIISEVVHSYFWHINNTIAHVKFSFFPAAFLKLSSSEFW